MSIKDPANPAKPEEKPGFSERLNDFLRANRVALFAVAALIVVGVVGLGVSSAINQSKLKSSTEALEKLESRFEEWAQTEEADRTALSAELLTEADALVARYGKLYASLRAGFMKARLHYANADYAAAEARTPRSPWPAPNPTWPRWRSPTPRPWRKRRATLTRLSLTSKRPRRSTPRPRAPPGIPSISGASTRG